MPLNIFDNKRAMKKTDYSSHMCVCFVVIIDMLMNKIHIYRQAPEVMEQDHGYDFKAGKNKIISF